MNIEIKIDQLKADSISDSSGIFSGENYHALWFAMSKSNSGLGDISGEKNVCSKAVNIVHDSDLADVIRMPLAICPRKRGGKDVV